MNADSLEDNIAKLTTWEDGMEGRDLRDNMKKTKLMILIPVHSLTSEVCLGVKGKSIEGFQCKLWLHKKSCGIRLVGWFVALRPSKQLWSYRDGQFT